PRPGRLDVSLPADRPRRRGRARCRPEADRVGESGGVRGGHALGLGLVLRHAGGSPVVGDAVVGEGDRIRLRPPGPGLGAGDAGGPRGHLPGVAELVGSRGRLVRDRPRRGPLPVEPERDGRLIPWPRPKSRSRSAARRSASPRRTGSSSPAKAGPRWTWSSTSWRWSRGRSGEPLTAPRWPSDTWPTSTRPPHTKHAP